MLTKLLGKRSDAKRKPGPAKARQESERTVFRDLLPTLITMVFLLLVGGLSYNQYYEASLRTALSKTTSSILTLVDSARESGSHAIAIKAPLEEILIEHARHSFVSELFLHLAVALIVAFVVIGSVEISATLRRRREMMVQEQRLSLSVWSALFERFVPDKVVREIEDIARLDVVKERCHYTISFLPPYPGMPQDTLVMKRELRYTIRNLKNKSIEFPLKSKISSGPEDCLVTDQDGKTITIPRHVRLVVGGKEIDLASIVHENELGQLRNLSHTVPIGRDQGPVDVDLCGEEIVACEGSNSYLQLSTVSELTVEIRNQCPQSVKILEVQFNHPNYADFKRRGEWVFEYQGGMLPGQSFHVSWGRVTTPERQKAELAVNAPPPILAASVPGEPIKEGDPKTQQGEMAEATPPVAPGSVA